MTTWRPMMLDREVRVLEQILLTVPSRPLRVLEWGSGGSTIYFTQFLKAHNIPYEWVSIEYNKRWATTVTEGLEGDPHTAVVLFDVGNDSVLQRDTPMNEYVAYPRTLGTSFDVILVDGRKRRRCLIEARTLVAEHGVVICHDAERHYYQCAFPLYPRGRYLAGRVWVGSLDIPSVITEVSDRVRSVYEKVLWRSWRTLYQSYKALIT